MSFDDPSRPWPQPKRILPGHTLCEPCDKSIRTLDFPNHLRGKKHREAVKKAELEKSTKEAAKPAQETNGFTPDAGSDINLTGLALNINEFETNTNEPDNNDGFNSISYGNNKTYGGGRSGGRGGGGGGGGGRACHRCGNSDHIARDCTEPRTDIECRRCHQTGHMAKDCPNGGGGGGECHNCGSTEHKARECPEPKNISRVKCNNCDGMGHYSKECPEPRDWSRVKCNNCGQNGHTVKRCKEPPQEPAADFGAYGGGDFGGGGATGGWDAGTTEETSGDWDKAPENKPEMGWDGEPLVQASGGWD